jgi:hypothetical protein
MLQEGWAAGKLRLRSEVMSAGAFQALLARVRSREWVVYCKPPFAGPSQVLRYLANYTHRIAISNARILAFDGERVTFRYRDSARQNSPRTMALDADEFLRRFILHVLPSRFVRIRYYGFMANRLRTRSIQRARELIVPHTPVSNPPTAELTHHGPTVCPRCSIGVMRRVAIIAAPRREPLYEDSS